jgi:hypothetical protein
MNLGDIQTCLDHVTEARLPAERLGHLHVMKVCVDKALKAAQQEAVEQISGQESLPFDFTVANER